MNDFGIGRLANRAAVVALTLLLGAMAVGAAAYPPQGPGTAGHPRKATTLVSLTRQTGEAPYGGLILANDGNFYGVTSSAGGGGNGNVYRMTPAGEISVVYSFPHGGVRNSSYLPLLQGSDGALYGIEEGHRNGISIVFRVTLDGEFTQLQTFDWPTSRLILGRDGYLYGTVKNGNGELFKISNTGVLTVIASFDDSTPYLPEGPPLEGDDGNFYVAAIGGGSHGYGGILKISPGGTVTTVYEFTGSAPVGGTPVAPLAYDAAHEYMWGVTSDYSADQTVVYRYKAGAVEEVGSLSKFNTSDPTLGPDGVHFYLTCMTTVYSFALGEGDRRVAVLPGKTGLGDKLMFNAAGDIFGTTTNGGTENGGTIFKVKNF